MARFGGSLGLLVGEARIVDQELGLVRRQRGHLAGSGVARHHHLSAAPHRSHHLLGLDRAVWAPHRLSRLEPAEIGAGTDAELLGERGIEPPRPLVLDQGVAVGANPMIHPERADLVPGVADRFPLLELHELEVV